MTTFSPFLDPERQAKGSIIFQTAAVASVEDDNDMGGGGVDVGSTPLFGWNPGGDG